MIKDFTQKAVALNTSRHETVDLHLQTVIESNFEKMKAFVEILKNYEAILFHKNVAKCQRQSYNSYTKNVDKS